MTRQRSFLGVLLNTYVRQHWRVFSASVAYALIKSFMPLIIIWAVSRVVDILEALGRQAIDPEAARQKIVEYSLLGILAFLIAVFPTYWRDAVPGRMVRTIVMRIRRDLYAHMLTLSQSFFDARRSGTLASRMTSDVEALVPFLQNVCVQFPMAVILTLAVMGYFLTQSVTLALVSIALLPIQAIAQHVIARRMKSEMRSLLECTSDLSGSAQERLAATGVVKSFTGEQDEVARFDVQARPIVEIGARVSRLSGMSQVVSQSLQMLGPLSFALVGGVLATRPGSPITIGMLIEFILMQGRILQPIIWILDMQTTIATAGAAADRIFQTLQTQPDVQDRVEAVVAPPLSGAIRFENVTFSYLAVAKPAVTDFSLTIRRHETVAVVGPSGAGKTTIATLLNRFYDPQHGRILIDGQDIRDFTQQSLRLQIGLVPQNPTLFSASIYDNILYGRPDAQPEDVYSAAKKAHAHMFIEALDGGYDAIVGERGARLSGGQCQRIAIARVFLKNPAIVILDEATSALDSRSESIVTEALKALMRDRTTIVIAHRFSTFRDADRIVVMADGRLVEEGSHAALIESGNMYASLYGRDMSPPSDATVHHGPSSLVSVQ